MNTYNPRVHGMSFYLKESLRKELHAYEDNLTDHLHGSCLLAPKDKWPELIPPAQFDAWMTLRCWLDEGEPVVILNPLADDGAADPLPMGSQQIVSASLKDEALAFRSAQGDDWGIIARHLQASGDYGREWGYRFPALSYVCRISGITSAGAFSLSGISTWEQLEWPAEAVMDPVTEQRRTLTRRVSRARQSSMKAVLGEFSKAVNSR